MAQVITTAERALRHAVVQIATEKPISEVNVSEVCRRAEITRDSFYRFASSPAALLAMHLYDDHDTDLVTPSHKATVPTVRALTPATRVLLEHVQRNRQIYLNALTPRLPMELREALLQRLEAVLYAHAREFPEKLPDIQGRRPTEESVSVLVHHASNGVVGAIEFLVATDAIEDIEHAIAVLHAATVPCWLAYD